MDVNESINEENAVEFNPEPEIEFEEKFKVRDDDYESDFEAEFELGDGLEVWSVSDMKETILSHPEGSFLALVHDKSEQDISALLEKKSKGETQALKLDSILPEVSILTKKQCIWKHYVCF